MLELGCKVDIICEKFMEFNFAVFDLGILKT